MSLTTEDLDRVLDVVHSVGQAESRDDFVSLTLQGAQYLIPCMLVALNEVDPAAGRSVYRLEPSSFPEPANARRLLSELVGENPLVRHLQATGDGSAWRISDLATREEFHATRLYQQLYRPMGMEYQLSVTLPAPAPIIFALVLGDGDDDFSERDRAVMNKLRPHLAQSWRRLRDHVRLQTLLDTTQDVAVSQKWGVIMLSDPPEEVTPGALTALYRHFGRPSRTSPFPARVQAWLSVHKAGGMLSGGLELSHPLSASFGTHKVVLRYLPPRRTHPGAILLRDNVTTGRRDLESLGLSAREAEVVHLVTAGVTNSAIAERLNLSTGTVRKHLDNVYNKLGVRGRVAVTTFVLDINAAEDLLLT